ncbi:MAG: hypothetical protein M9894_26525 [Planctomycetes bacterium]|nr:hypothetical protein [Planctomycetota bacterium]
MDRRRRQRSRREGSALILVMLVLLMLTGMVLLLLESARTSHQQATTQVSLAQARAVADAAMRRAVLRLSAGDVPAVGTPIVLSDQAFGGAAFAGRYDYRLSVARTTPTRVFLVEAEGRVRTTGGDAASDWLRSGVQVWIEEVVTGNPPSGNLPGAVTVVSDQPLPTLQVHKSGNPPKISGRDHSLGGALLGDQGGSGSAVATTAEASTSWSGAGSPPGDILGATLESTSPIPTHSNAVPYSSMQEWIQALRDTSASTPTSPIPSSFNMGSAEDPVIVKYDLGADGSVSVPGGTQFYGLMIIKVPSEWTGASPALVLNGNAALHGLVYFEMDTLGTNANATSQPLIRINGGGNEHSQTGALLVDVKSKGGFTASTKQVVSIGGGGVPSRRNIALSTEGINMVRGIIGTPTGTSFRTLAYKVTGGLELAP